MRLLRACHGCILLCAVLMMCGSAQADHLALEFEYQPGPGYPWSLYDGRVSGSVLVDFMAHHDGTITDVNVIDSTHATFAEFVKDAISRWRLAPWHTNPERPASIVARKEFFFIHPNDGNSVHRWARSQVRHLSCHTLNKAVEAFRTDSPARDMMDMRYFRYTFMWLARHATLRKMSDQQRAELGDDFAQAIPAVINACTKAPQLRYRDVLPDVVRAVL